ncbi:MAG: hypothetical protein V4496_06020 [Pseudomonadota bacterium]
MLENVITTRELITQISLSNQLAFLTEANNHLQSLMSNLANYQSFQTMLSKLPVTRESAIENKLQTLKKGLITTEQQVSALLNQPAALYHDRQNFSDNEQDIKRPRK